MPFILDIKPASSDFKQQVKQYHNIISKDLYQFVHIYYPNRGRTLCSFYGLFSLTIFIREQETKRGR